MEIIHRISINTLNSPGIEDLLIKLGIKAISSPLPGKGKLITFELSESNANWDKIQGTLGGRGLDLVNTLFSEGEIRDSEWIRVIPNAELGFPHPRSAWFDNRPNWQDWCKKCGVHRQIASYQVKESNFRRTKHFSSVIGIYILLARMEVIQSILEMGGNGFEVLDVINYQSGEPADFLRQLYPSTVLPLGVVIPDDHIYNICSECGFKKYLPHMRGYMAFHGDAFKDVNVDIIRSSEWFGDGALAYQEIIISNRLANLLLDNKWQGIQLKGIELID